MNTLLTITESRRVDTQAEADQVITDAKNAAREEGYALISYKTNYKTKKAKGQIVEDGYEVTLVKRYNDFWEAGAF